MVADEGEGAKYWPRWRGPSGQGVVTGTGYVDTWSATQNVLWKTAVPGRGNSSPIVWGDRIFLTTAYEGGRRVSLLAYQPLRRAAALGDRGAGGPHRLGAHYKNGHASATPATDGQRVYVSFGASRSLCRSISTARIVWQRDLGAMEAYHGTAGSPLLYRDRIILYQDQYRGLLHRRVRHANGPPTLADAARGQQRVGHADRRPRRRPTTRSSSAVSSRCRPTIPSAAGSCGGAAATPTK